LGHRRAADRTGRHHHLEAPRRHDRDHVDDRAPGRGLCGAQLPGGVESQRDAFFAGLDEQFAPLEIDWNVSSLMLGYPDNPSHEAFMPNFPEADSANKDLGSRLWTTPDLDIGAELDSHVELLQGIFDEAG
jgi:hypothetical protein